MMPWASHCSEGRVVDLGKDEGDLWRERRGREVAI